MKVKKNVSLQKFLGSLYPNLSQKEIYSSIMCGEFYVNGELIKTPKTLVPSDSYVECKPKNYVSRGGKKLEAALDYFYLSPANLVCLDAGASTGGFTDCLLRRGAKIVHSVDVGYNQIDWSLRIDKRVKVREKTNVMKLLPGDLVPKPEFATADLSFRSLRKAASKLLDITSGNTVIALAKPQFENPEIENFNGVIHSREVRAQVIFRLKHDLVDEGVYITDCFRCPLSGRKGNIEIFILLSRKPPANEKRVDRNLQEAI